MTRCSIYINDGMRKRSSMEAKAGNGQATYEVTHVMIVACPSPAFTFTLLHIFHAIITAFVCILFLDVLVYNPSITLIRITDKLTTMSADWYNTS